MVFRASRSHRLQLSSPGPDQPQPRPGWRWEVTDSKYRDVGLEVWCWDVEMWHQFRFSHIYLGHMCETQRAWRWPSPPSASASDKMVRAAVHNKTETMNSLASLLLTSLILVLLGKWPLSRSSPDTISLSLRKDLWIIFNDISRINYWY